MSSPLHGAQRGTTLRYGLFGLLSLSAHALLLLFAWLTAEASDDAPLLEFKLPAEAEFGVMGGTGEPAPSEAPPPAPPPKQEETPKKKRRKRPKKEPVVQASNDGFGPPVDAAVPDELVEAEEEADEAAVAGLEQDGKGSELSGVGLVQGATGEGLGVGAGGHGLGGFAPPGAHIGLHVNTRRVADTSLILEVNSLLNIIPGWEDVLRASGLNPLNHLTQIFVATPDMRRSSVVVAAHFKGTGKRIEKAVARLSKKQRSAAPWAQRGDIRMAPWLAPGNVDRTIAITGPKSFVITKSDDVSRVVSVVRAVEAAEGAAQKRDPRAPKDLFRLYRDEAVALSIEDSRKFVVGEPPGVPRRARLSVRSIDELHAGLAVIGQYEDKAKASAAKAYLEGLQEKLLSHSQVKFLGLVSALEAAEIRQDGRYLVLEMELTMHQTRFLLDYVSDVMKPRG